jgi:hypothetical protein
MGGKTASIRTSEPETQHDVAHCCATLRTGRNTSDPSFRNGVGVGCCAPAVGEIR